MEDQQIIELYWARSEQAIRESETKYGAFCLSIARNILAQEQDAEECVNDTWLRAWNAMPPQRPGSLGAYLARITRNLSIDRWRSRRSQKRGAGMEALVLELEDCVPAVPSAEAEFEAREVAAATGTPSGWTSWPGSLDAPHSRWPGGCSDCGAACAGPWSGKE